MTKANLSKTYNPKDFEQRLYQEWMDKGYFKSSPNPDKKPFCIVLQMCIRDRLTTAAGIWATACIGIAIGYGQYILGISAWVLEMITLLSLKRIDKLFFKKEVRCV